MGEGVGGRRFWIGLPVIVIGIGAPGLRELYRHAPAPAFAWLANVALLIALWTVACSSSPRTARILRSGYLAAALVAGVTAASIVLYPRRGPTIGALGSTTDDALRLPFQALIHGDALYSARLFDGAPASPGPGWILANFVFLAAASPYVYALLNPFWIGATVAVLRRLASTRAATTWLLVLLATPATIRLVSEGHDLIPMGCAVILLSQLLTRSRTIAPTIGWGVVAGVLATARVVLLPLPVLCGVLMWRRSRRLATLGSAIGVALTTVLHWSFSRGIDPYPPFHLFTRAEDRTGPGLLIVGLLLTAATSLVALQRARTTGSASWPTAIAVACSGPLITVSLGELIAGDYRFDTWEGANYLLLAGVLLLAAVVTTSDGRAEPGTESGSARFG